MIAIAVGREFESWRDHARQLLTRGIPPGEVDWTETGAESSLFESKTPLATPADPSPPSPAVWRVPASFVGLARTAWAHRDARRAMVLYRVLWRLTRGGEPQLLAVLTDPDRHLVEGWRKSVARDIHKMHAFVRFRLVGTDGTTGREQFVAWFEPPSRCVRLAAPFFMKRFAGMNWAILTPDECAHWDGETLYYTPGLSRNEVPGGDALDELWRTYYRSIFNPARLKVKAMQSEMPAMYWKNLPEADLIPGLIASGLPRMEEMIQTPGRGLRPVPDNSYLRKLHDRHNEIVFHKVPDFADLTTLSIAEQQQAASACRGCPLWARATQTVCGEGPVDARVMIVGEQPGDQEDLAGKPFTGPAGQVLRNTLMLAGLEADSVYLTNAVKHFKWTPDGRKRKHLSPDRAGVKHCRPWVLAEVAGVRPRVLVLLGRTAGFSLLGRTVDISRERGTVLAPHLADRVILTWHPSYLLRLPAGGARSRATDEFEKDLRLAAAPI